MTKVDFFRCCLVIADHNSYHIGELAIGRQMAGLWPKGRKDYRGVLPLVVMSALTPTVLDTDPGIDDALALLLAWGSPELDVLALTVVAGNAPLADTARNAARLVAVRRPARPPRIALGAAAPLRRPLVTVTHDQHGNDSLGDVP